MPKYTITEVIHQVNRIEVEGDSAEQVEERYWDGEFNDALNDGVYDIEVVHNEVEEVVESEPFDYSPFIAKEKNE